VSQEESWAQRRRDAAAEHAAAQERRRAAESERARALVADFVAEARARGLPTTSLTARAYDGRSTYRTGLTGWYVRRNHTIGVGEDGEFYVLSVPTSWRARFRGATVAPSDPPLVVGAGGRDGESIGLADLLRQRLDADNAWD
jgi:hypothetical protein